MKTVQCPSCGAVASNLKNCEFCGSLFVRFENMHLDSIKMLSENDTYLGLEEKIYQAIDQCSSNIYVNLYIKLGEKLLFQLSRSSMINNYLNDLNVGMEIDDEDGIGIVNIITENQQVYLNRLMDLEESLLFYQSSESENSFFAIDFGKDAKGAAALCSLLLKKVYRINPKSALIYEIESWNDDKTAVENKKGNCFIATATMGSYDHPYVVELRDFRDNWILKKHWGEGFVKWYYHYGSIAAKGIEKSFVLSKCSYWLIVTPLIYFSRIIKSKKE